MASHCGKKATVLECRVSSNLIASPRITSVGVNIGLNTKHLEQTIAEPIEFAGVGLHSGAPVTMRLLPAPAGRASSSAAPTWTTLRFPRSGRNVAKVSYATSLMRQGVLISTTEHLLSALIGMGVDNVIVEVDNLELPILDGSALPYVEAFRAGGHPGAATAARVHPRAEAGGSARRRQVYRRLSGVGLLALNTRIDFPAPIGRQSACSGPGHGDLRRADCAGADVRLQGRRAASCATWG